MESRVSAYRSHSLSLARHTSNSCPFFLSATRMPIPSLLSQRTGRFLLFVFSAAQGHTNPYSLSSALRKRIPIRTLCLQRRASTYLSILFVFGAVQAHTNPYSLSLAPRKRIPIPFLLQRAQAHTDRYSLSSAPRKRIPIRSLCLWRRVSTYQFLSFFSAQKRIPICTLCLWEFTHVCTSQSQGECGSRPRACSSWPVPTARYGAAANLVVPIASMGHTVTPERTMHGDS